MSICNPVIIMYSLGGIEKESVIRKLLQEEFG